MNTSQANDTYRSLPEQSNDVTLTGGLPEITHNRYGSSAPMVGLPEDQEIVDIDE